MRKNYVLFLCICSASLFFSTLGVRAGQVNEDLQMETEVQEQEYNGFHKQMKVTLDKIILPVLLKLSLRVKETIRRN